jgi:hypothetical protein
VRDVTRRTQRFWNKRANENARAPRGQGHPDLRGSYVDLDDLRVAAEEASMRVERVIGRGTQFCLVRLRRLARE